MSHISRQCVGSAAAPVGWVGSGHVPPPHDQPGRECPDFATARHLRGDTAIRSAFRAVCRDWVLSSGADVFGKVPVRSRSVWGRSIPARPIQVDVAVLARMSRGARAACCLSAKPKRDKVANPLSPRAATLTRELLAVSGVTRSGRN
jgi:hypothetical protein